MQRLIPFLIGSIFFYRLVTFSIPQYRSALMTHPLANVLTGFFSDLSLLCFYLFLAVLILKLGKGLFKKVLSGVWIAAALFLILSSLTHIKYLEHFGMNIRPTYLGTINNFETLLADIQMLLGSYRAWFFAVMTLLSPLFFRKCASNYFSALLNHKYALLFLPVVYVAFNSLNIHMRNKPGVHRELRYNLLVSFFYNYKEFHEYMDITQPDVEQALALRESLFGKHHWIGDEGFPFSQFKLVEPKEDKLEKELSQFIRDEAKQKGPWNVLVVLQESLRAHELGGYGTKDPFYLSRTTRLKEHFESGVSFTETYAAGIETRVGQMASFCSMPATLRFPILHFYPLMNLYCLPNAFPAPEYDSYFFHGADNHFDNQGEFYGHHGVQNILDESDFPKGAVKGGWGYSDHELYNFTLAKLKKAKKPFFGITLTLTNHEPYVLPSDAPSSIDTSAPITDQLIAYVDWAFDEFYETLKRDHPHTIVIFTADHGNARSEMYAEYSMNNDPDLFRKITRIPWTIMIPDLPEHLKGRTYDKPVSQMDITPTMLSLLGKTEAKHSMLGTNAFSRQEPIYSALFGTHYKLTFAGEQANIEALKDDFFAPLISLIAFNRMLPSES